jgi:hypothetical protein
VCVCRMPALVATPRAGRCGAEMCHGRCSHRRLHTLHTLHTLKCVMGVAVIGAGVFVCFGVHRVHRISVAKEQRQQQEEEQARTPPGGGATRRGGARGSALVTNLCVANHLGWLDILVMLSSLQCTFVAQAYVERAPIVGTVARALFVIFVGDRHQERGGGGDIGGGGSSAIRRRVEAAERCSARGCTGCSACFLALVIFAEGTTTNGLGMLTFRTGAFVACAPLTPVCLRFCSIRRFNPTWETIAFREHLWRTMTQWSNSIELLLLPPYLPPPRTHLSHTTEQAAQACNLSARLTADRVQEAMVRLVL